MNESFDDELRRSLRDRADRVPRRPDLSQGAISQARGIRRRRQVAGAVAATALVAIAVPLGLRVGDAVSNGQEPVNPATTGPPPTVQTPTATANSPDQSPPSSPDETDPSQPTGETGGPSGEIDVLLDLRELSEGEAPAIAYLAGSTIVRPDYTIDVSGSVTAAAPVVDGAYVTGEYDTDGWPLTRYAADGGTEDLGTVQAPPVASADGRWVAYATGETDQFGNTVGPASLVVVDDETGESSSVELAGASYVEILTIVDGTVYFTYDARSGRTVPLQTWSMGDAEPEQVPGGITATAVSSDGTLVASLRFVDDFEQCGTVVNLSTGDETQELCGTYLSIQGFSPDGRYAWAANAEGYGPTEVIVIDTQTGEIVRSYDSLSQRHSISFMDTTFEDDETLLLRAEQDDGTALVRCDVTTGDCEAAEPLADGTSETGSPYLLPAVR